MGWCSMTPRDKEALERIIECADAINAYVERTGDDWAVPPQRGGTAADSLGQGQSAPIGMTATPSSRT
jgi:hypothetical protein